MPWLLLALSSNSVALFMSRVVLVFSFFGKFLLLPLSLLLVRPLVAV
jgi:hypothetical protein